MRLGAAQIAAGCGRRTGHDDRCPRAQDALGDIVYVELPQMGELLQASVEAGVVESVKAASDIYAPVSGVVVAVNQSLEDAPEAVNADAYGDGWFFALEPSDVGELEGLKDAGAYRELVAD